MMETIEMSYLQEYFAKVAEGARSPAAIAYLANLDVVRSASPSIAASIVQELADQRKYLKLIASENYCSLPVQLAMGNLLTDKYSEGYVGHRFYAGCDNVDAIEGEANELAKQVFGADHAYVQPHSGADANLVALWAILVHRVQNREIEALGKKTLDELTPEEYERVRQLLVNQKLMGMGLNSGGHLTHGYRHNVSSKMFHSYSYDVDPKTGLLDYAILQRQVKEVKPLVLIAGYSAYPRLLDFAKMREIADSVGAVLFTDMAHFAGLVAGKALTGVHDPIPYSHIVTSTTHKTLRGPRGGLVLCTSEYKEAVDKGCPIVLGGPLPQVMAAKAIAFKEAATAEFQVYSKKIIQNAKALADALVKKGCRVLTGGTDNHLVLFDVETSYKLNGRQAENLLREAHLTVNRNSIPGDKNGAWYTSGIRVGTPATTTLGMGPIEMQEIGAIMHDLLSTAQPTTSRAKAAAPEREIARARGRVKELLSKFPLYPELTI